MAAQPDNDRSVQKLQARMRHLPAQLDRARRRVVQLENEARRYRMTELVGGDAR